MGLRVELGEGDMDCESEFITLSREFVLSRDVFGVAMVIDSFVLGDNVVLSETVSG